MAIEKSLLAEAPEGENLTGEELEIEIVDPEMVTLDDGSVEVTNNSNFDLMKRRNDPLGLFNRL